MRMVRRAELLFESFAADEVIQHIRAAKDAVRFKTMHAPVDGSSTSIPPAKYFGAIAFGDAGTASVPLVSVFLMTNVTSPAAFVFALRSAPDADSDAGTPIFVVPEIQLALETLYGEFT